MIDHTRLLAWQRAHSVVKTVLDLSDRYWTPRGAAIFDQLKRASLSAQTNICEGYARYVSRQKLNHYRIAYGSAVETLDLLVTVRDGNLAPPGLVEPTIATAGETCALLLGLIKRLQA